MRFIIAVLLIASGQTANAVPLIGTLTGIGDGTFAGTSFSNTFFTISAVGDTNDIYLPTDLPPGAPLLSVSALYVTATISVESIGSGTFTNPITLASNRALMKGGIGDQVANRGVVFVENSVFRTYGLDRSLGPLAGIGSFSPNIEYPTTAGTFSLTALSSATFEVEVVPEPAAVTLSIAALSAPCLVRRASKGRRRP
jgi:hypothetical protein